MSLEKDRNLRYQHASEVRADLARLARKTGPTTFSLKSLVVAAVVVIAGVGWLWHRSSQERWARETATPEIARLVEAGEFVRAASFAREARAILPEDPTLAKLWMQATAEATIKSEPPGADVSIRP